ncbi:major facilitator superfamily domain-containing protein [Dactylonectria estremocensis]|uniref:Major facilitator superfamily domain-containing protein n=1 Tax=Dactylonectria estremocensis TaxID=1079267 RepID=A0A9P9D3F2_9HYPO|nr:major facilitator superfamily domain-containing protein [Dactylonectria estremocensis]
MMVIISSGSLARIMVADIGGTDKVQWISQSVPIVNLALGAPVAQAADYWGRKWFLVISCAFAVVGSIIVSRATNIDMALAGNALASISTSAQPLLFAVASEILPRRWRPAAQGGVTGIFAVAAILGLLMGSALTKSNPSGWRIVWYFNTGCFAFTTLILLFLYNPPPRAEQINFTSREKLKKLDWMGIIMLPVAVTILCIGLTWSQNPFSWKNAHVLAPFVAGFVLVICLALYEGFIKKDGLFHHGLFKNDRNFAISCFLIFTEGMAFFVANSYVPLEVSVVFETDSVLVSLNFAIVFIGAIVGSIIASIYCSWSRQLRWPLVISYVGFVLFYATMMSVGFGDYTNIWGFNVFLGLGFGGCLTCIVVAAQFSAPPELLAISSGALITARAGGAAICFAIGNAIFNSQIGKNLPKDIASTVLPLGLPPQSLGPFIEALANHNDRALATIEGVTPQIIQAGVHGLRQAYITSLRPLHGFGLALSVIAVIASVFIIDPKRDFTMAVDAPLDAPKEPQE